MYMNGYDRRWFAVPRTATKPESLQGFHEDNMLFVVDEASGVADPILDAIGGTLTGANNRLLYCGNPTKATGGFAESFQGDGMDWYCMTVSSRDSPRTSKENIAALEKKYGKNSNVVRVRVDGLPPVADSDVFIPSYIAEKATMNEPLPHDSPVRLSIGCDVARFGDDCTVIAPNIDAENASLLINFCFPAERVPINGYISLLPHCLYLIILRCDRGHAHPDQPVLAIRAAFPLTAERFKCGNHAVVADFRLNREPLPIIVVLDLTDGNVIFDGGLGVCPLVVQPFGQTLEGSANIGNFHGLLLYHS